MMQKICPMKFSMNINMDDSSVMEPENRYCVIDECAWWDTGMKKCHVVRIGRFMESLHKELGNIAINIREHF